jgi:hypothetical protein
VQNIIGQTATIAARAPFYEVQLFVASLLHNILVAFSTAVTEA